jgi:hypothetical protein
MTPALSHEHFVSVVNRDVTFYILYEIKDTSWIREDVV